MGRPREQPVEPKNKVNEMLRHKQQKIEEQMLRNCRKMKSD
jgi:hypothetical protein